MNLSNNSLERICRVFGYLGVLANKDIDFVSSRELADGVGTTDYIIRKDLSLLGVTGYTRRGYDVRALKEELGRKLYLTEKRKACIVGLGRLGTALLDYEKFQEDGFDIVAGFDRSINKIERICSNVNVFGADRLEEIIRQRNIELGIITVPVESAQNVADRLAKAGVKGILNFSPVRLIVPKHIMYLDLDFTNALRFIAARFMIEK